MARGLMERVLNPEQIDQWFEQAAEEQYTRELLFSTLFDMMSDVVCGARKSVHGIFCLGFRNEEPSPFTWGAASGWYESGFRPFIILAV